MSTFKDCLQTDNDVFFNVDEFAEIRTVEGKEVEAILDANVTKQHQGSSPYFQGTYSSEKVLYVKMIDLEYKPAIGERLEVDGERYTVVTCDEHMGILQITLEANEA